MRGTIAGLATPAPLAETLPAMLREDHFAQQLCASLDEVLAPVILSLDALPAYLDLSTTPEDMLPWLAQWLGMSVDPGQDMEIQRSLLRSASELHATRGTRRGIQLAVEAAIGAAVEVVETGATTWSATPGGELPGNSRPGHHGCRPAGDGSGDRRRPGRGAGPIGQTRPHPAPGPGRRALDSRSLVRGSACW